MLVTRKEAQQSAAQRTWLTRIRLRETTQAVRQSRLCTGQCATRHSRLQGAGKGQC